MSLNDGTWSNSNETSTLRRYCEFSRPAYSAANATVWLELSNSTTARYYWLHVPKAGTNFLTTLCLYSCEMVGNFHNSSIGLTCPRLSTHFHTGHVPVPPIASVLQQGVVALFRHPRSRMASFCRSQQFQASAGRQNLLARIGILNESSCLVAMAMRHGAVQTRMVAGLSCGGPKLCNTPIKLSAFNETLAVRVALARLSSAFAFIGLTEEWDASIQLFHARLMPMVPVHTTELQPRHTSVPGSSNISQESSMIYHQERMFASFPPNARVAIQNDPDALIFARARQLFCSHYRSAVLFPRCNHLSAVGPSTHIDCILRQTPSTCIAALGPLVGVPAPSAKEQYEHARGLMDRLRIPLGAWYLTPAAVAGLSISFERNQ